jgi:thiosulfate/3-mercaptopyruvate sulfurtransferase
VKKGNYNAKLNKKLLRTYEEIVENTKLNMENKGEQVIDARSEGRFKGTAPEPRPGIQSGSIPQSLNVPFETVLDLEGLHFLPKEKLIQVFQSRGVQIDKPSIFSCGSGVTASIIYFAMELCGNQNISVYDGSWAEYAVRSGKVL